jgi:hypothetical protein
MTRSSLSQALVKAERRASEKRRDQERAEARARKLVSWKPSR